MQENRLISEARNNYKNAPFSTWFLGLTVGILITAILAIDYLAPGISLLTFAFLIVPILFSGMLQHIVFKTRGQLTISSSLKAFGLYYTPSFFGTFSILTSALKGLITFLATETIISFTCSGILQFTNPEFVTAINEFYEIFESQSISYDDLFNALYAHNNLLFNYFVICVFPALGLGIIFAFYNISRNSILVYFKMHVKNVTNRFAKMVYSDVVRRNRKAMFKDYMMLNWPLFVLMAIGFAGGALGGYFWQMDFMIMLPFSLVAMAFMGTFFLPFYFGNQEAFYDKYVHEFQISVKQVTNFLLNSLQNNIDLSTEEKEKLERSMNDLENPLEDADENNKKDPD